MSYLIISRGFYPDQIGGLEVQTSLLYNYLKTKDKTLIISRIFNSEGNKKDSFCFTQKYDKSNPLRYLNFLFFGVLKTFQQRKNFKVIFSFGGEQSSIIAFLANIILGKKYIVSLRSEKHLSYTFINYFIFKLVISKASAIHVQTEVIRENFIEYYGSNYNIVKIPNMLKIENRHIKLFSERKYDVVFVGNRHSNIGYEKGYSKFLDICENVNLSLNISLIGERNLLSKKIGSKHKIHNLKKASRDVLIDIFSDSRLLIMCSKSEGMPNIIAECMSVGTPTISPKVGGIPDIIKNNITGLLLDDFKTDSYVSELENILQNPEIWQSYSQMCINQSKVYSENKIGPKFELLLNC